MTARDELEEQAKDGYFDAELRARYLNHRGHSRRRILRWLSAGSALLGSTAVVGLVAEGPKPLALSTAAAAAALSALGVAFGQGGREESQWLGLAAKWSARSAEWYALWKDSLAGTPPTLQQVRRLRAGDKPLMREDGFPRKARLIRKLQRQIAEAEGYSTETQRSFRFRLRAGPMSVNLESEA